jgi:hypothetical protein
MGNAKSLNINEKGRQHRHRPPRLGDDVRRSDDGPPSAGGGASCFSLGFTLWSTRWVSGEKGLVVFDRAFDQSPEPVGGMLASGQQRGSEISTINITMLASGQLRLFPADRGAIGGGSEKLLDEDFAETLEKRPPVVWGGGGMVAALRRIVPLHATDRVIEI